MLYCNLQIKERHKMTQKYVLVSDFDGTITSDDFFTLIADKYFDEQTLAPWRQYLSGKMTHLNALKQMFAQIHLSSDELLKFINQISYDPKFIDTVKLCSQKNIPVYICSAGCDYYINKLIGDIIKEYNITVVSNHGIYDEKCGLQMVPPPENSPFYDEKIGISKAAVVKKLHQEGYKVIFAGDGPPDFAPAGIADVVFAKKRLLAKCIEANIKTEKFDDFQDIFNFIEELP